MSSMGLGWSQITGAASNNTCVEHTWIQALCGKQQLDPCPQA